MGIRLFRRSKKSMNQSNLVENSHQMKPVFEIPKGSDIEKQLQMISLTEEDLSIAMVLKPYVEEHISTIVQAFYSNLSNIPELITIIEKYSSLDRLKITLNRHIIEMFSGELNTDFIEKRKVIANMHLHIGLTQKWYIASFEKLFAGLTEMIMDHFDANDTIIALGVLNKLLNLEKQVVLEAYDDEGNRQRDAEVERQMQMIRSLENTSNELAALAQDTTASIEKLTAQIKVVITNSVTGTEVSKDAKSLADQGQNRLISMDESLVAMETGTIKVNEDIASLESTATQIKDIINIVDSIASQTNLLALNASIEAARAGEHGAGFAVVADEVRKLAEETGRSVQSVTGLVNQTSEQVQIGAKSIQEVEACLTDVRTQMQHTETAFHKIDQSLSTTQQSNQNIQNDLEGFGAIIQDIGEAATTITQSAENLNQMIENNII